MNRLKVPLPLFFFACFAVSRKTSLALCCSRRCLAESAEKIRNKNRVKKSTFRNFVCLRFFKRNWRKTREIILSPYMLKIF